MVVGPSQAGKTHLVLDMVTNSQLIFDPPPHRIIWCYTIYQKSYDEVKDLVEFTDISPKSDSFVDHQRIMLILDDIMHELNDQFVELFTRASHHRNMT